VHNAILPDQCESELGQRRLSYIQEEFLHRIVEHVPPKPRAVFKNQIPTCVIQALADFILTGKFIKYI
jgi:hypothetical protein